MCLPAGPPVGPPAAFANAAARGGRGMPYRFLDDALREAGASDKSRAIFRAIYSSAEAVVRAQSAWTSLTPPLTLPRAHLVPFQESPGVSAFREALLGSILHTQHSAHDTNHPRPSDSIPCPPHRLIPAPLAPLCRRRPTPRLCCSVAAQAGGHPAPPLGVTTLGSGKGSSKPSNRGSSRSSRMPSRPIPKSHPNPNPHWGARAPRGCPGGRPCSNRGPGKTKPYS